MEVVNIWTKMLSLKNKQMKKYSRDLLYQLTFIQFVN